MPVRWKVLSGTVGRSSIYARGKYRLTYAEGERIHAIPDTLGILVFEKESQAKDFAYDHYGHMIKVLARGRGKRIKLLSMTQQEDEVNNFYRLIKRCIEPTGSMSPPNGTLGYKSVIPLE